MLKYRKKICLIDIFSHVMRFLLLVLSSSFCFCLCVYVCVGYVLYIGDGVVDWDEFTTFCIYTGLNSQDTASADGDGGALDEYVIEYAEDKNLKDNINRSFAPLALMRHAPAAKKVMVVQDHAATLLLMDEHLNCYAVIDPKKYVKKEKENKVERDNLKDP